MKWFSPAASVVVDDLRRIKVSKPGGGGTDDALGPHIEPVQLQVVCRRIWNALPAEYKKILEDARPEAYKLQREAI